MIYCHASYLSALNFVSYSMDDVELIGLVWDDETKKIWHCAYQQKSIMLQQAIIVARNEANGKKDKFKIPAMIVKNQIGNIKIEAPHKLQFLGLVSLFTAQSSDRVIALSVIVFLYMTMMKILLSPIFKHWLLRHTCIEVWRLKGCYKSFS